MIFGILVVEWLRNSNMDYNKEINKIKNKRNRVLYLRYGIGFLFLGVCIFLVLLMAKSKFGYKDEQEIIRTVVGDFKYEPIKKIAFINDTYVSGGFPSKDSSLKLDKISCTDGAEASFDMNTWELRITNGVEKTKCSVYFKK